MNRITNIMIGIIVSMTQFALSARVVTGTVTGAGEPLIGVSIYEVGTSNGAMTDYDGNFTIEVGDNAVLTFNYVGFASQTISVTEQSDWNIVLVEDAAKLDEIVVIGYGTQKRSSMTSSVATVGVGDVKKQVSQNLASALQGRAAGVDVIQQGGIAGADVNIVVRGAASLTATEPLYVVDGVFTNNGLTTINPADVESIQILKDGAAAAIYGSRAANGVVIITTKKGTKGEIKVDANVSYSIQKITHVPNFLDANQWREFANMVSDNSGLARAPENVQPSNPGVDTDWAKEWLQYAPIFTADASIQSGNEHGSYVFSLGYLDQKGLTLKSGYKKYNARANSNWNFGRFFISENMQMVYRDKVPTTNFNICQPNLPLTDDKGRYSSWGTDYYIETENARKNNPFAGLYAVDRYNRNFDFMGGVNIGVNLIDGLKFTTSFSGNYTGAHNYTHTPVYYAMWQADGTPDGDYGNNINSLEESRGVKYNYTWDNVVNFDKSFGKHNVSATIGHSFMREFYRVQSYRTVADVGAPNITGVTNVDGKISSSEENSALLSFFGRLNYDYDNRYLLSASIRRDESSKFARGNRVGYFPAVSVGWNIHNEPWFNNRVVSLFKLTASYGELGANFLEPYNFDDIAFGPIPYTVGNIRYVDGRASYLKTKDLTWETSKTTDLGFEIGILNNMLTFSANYFYKKNINLLAPVSLNLSSGQIFEVNTSNETPYVNTASVENRGFEFMLGLRKQLGQDWHLGVTANVSTLRNKVLALGDNVQPITAGGYSSKFNDASTLTGPGNPIGSFYGYRIDGFDAEGNFAFSDLNGDGQITALDKTIIGNPIPDVTFGLNIDLTYRNFDLSMFFNGVSGNDIFNTMRYEYYFNYSNNCVEDVLKSWAPSNTTTCVPIAKVQNYEGANALPSEFYVEDGSYLRLKNVQLGYTLPSELTRKFFVKRLRVYLGIQNAFTLSKYSGYDPEVSSNALFTRGVDMNSYPNARSYTLGVNLSF